LVVEDGNLPAHTHEVHNCRELHIAGFRSVVDLRTVLELLEDVKVGAMASSLYACLRTPERP
jgi:hypothetical protein